MTSGKFGSQPHDASKNVQQINAVNPVRNCLNGEGRIIMAILLPIGAAIPNLIVGKADGPRTTAVGDGVLVITINLCGNIGDVVLAGN